MLFSIGNLITFFAVLLILVILRALDRNNRSLEKLKRFSDKITGNITALVEEKTAQLRDFTLSLQGSLTAGKEIMARTRTVEEALHARTAEVEGIRRSLSELGSVQSRVDQTLKRIRDESEIAESMGRKIVEAAGRLEKIEKKLPEIESGFSSRARQSLEAARTELMAAVEAKVGSLAGGLGASEKRLKDFSAYMARLEAREAQAEKERAAFLSRSLEAFEADLNGRLSRALQRAETLEDEVFGRLAEKIKENEAAFAQTVKAMEARLADYQGDIDHRVKALEESDGDIASLRAALGQSLQKVAGGVRTEMKQMAAGLVAGWQKEIAAATSAQEQIHAGLADVHSGLKELKTRAYQDVEKGLSAFEDEFFADLRARAAKAVDEHTTWQADMEKRMAGFEAELKSRLASADGAAQAVRERVATFESEIAGRLSRSMETIELRLTDYQGDVDGRIKAFADSNGEVEALRASLHQGMEKTAASVRMEMMGIAADLAAGWQAEMKAAVGAREKVHAELEKLKTTAAQAAEGELSAFEKEFSADMREQAAQALDKYRAWQADMQKRVEGVESELKSRLASADAAAQSVREHIAAYETEIAGRLSRNMETIELRLTDYQGDVDSRIKALADSNGEVEALRAALRENMEQAAASARAEMTRIAADLAKGWEGEAAAAAGAREKVRAALEELKAHALQAAESDISAVEKEFSADLRKRAAQALDKQQAWQADMEKRMEGFEGELKARLSSADEAVQNVRDTLRAEVEKTRKDSSLTIEKETAGVREALDGAVRRMQREIETRLRELSAELDTGRKDLTEVLDASRTEVVAWEGRARQQLAETEVSVAEKISRLATEAESSISVVRDEFSSQREEMLAAVSQEKGALKTELKEMGERISAFEAEMRRSADAAIEGIRAQMEKTGRLTSTALEKELTGLTEALESRSAAMHKEIETRMKELAALADTGRREAASQAESALAAIRESFATQKDELVAASNAEREALKKQMAEVGERISTFDVELSRTTDSTMEAIQVLRDSLHEEVEKARRESSLGMEKDLASLRESLETGSRRMQKEIETRMAGIAAEVETNRKEVSQLLEASSLYITSWESKTRQKLGESEAAMGRRISAIEAQASGSVEAARQAFAEQRAQLEAAIGSERDSFKTELVEMGGKIAALKSELTSSTEETLNALRSQADLLQADSEKRLHDFQGEVEARIREYRQLMTESREKAEGMQEKLFAKIDESYRLVSTNLADVEKRVKVFTTQTRLFDRADSLRTSLEGTIEEMKKEIAKLGTEKAELAETELQLARTKKLADEVAAKLSRFLSEKRRIDEMEGEFKKLLTLSRDIDLKVNNLSGSHDALQQIQAKIREFEEMGKMVESGVERLDKKQEIISVTTEGVDKNFQRLESMEKAIRQTDEEAAALEARVKLLMSDYEALAGRKKDAETVMEITGKLNGVIEELEKRLDKAQSSREWLARTETRFEEVGRQAQEQVRLLESIVKAESKKEKGDKGAPPMDKRETVVKLSHQGWSVQEIARVTQLSRGEVELILELAPKV